MVEKCLTGTLTTFHDLRSGWPNATFDGTKGGANGNGFWRLCGECQDYILL